MKTIYKYQLNTIGKQIITMPIDSEIISLQTQFGSPCIWAKVDDEKPVYDRTILTFGTGHPLPEGNIEFIGTYQISEFVFHVFEML
ncbi:hypothetical protein EG339_02740 [Chryseobacterium bernardetii]|uniref:DUF7352 domain-containing protein n=1 Tax=Chryseobacterium bernardetii TaxID=1241978 RepID=A0A3G6TBH2_9FLAO|nr:hypothetical protein [Chryseobacterium bernardetii]AZB23614.1 hypothetical protein EG339_02740 [Chryseobacterium bernardetii]